MSNKIQVNPISNEAEQNDEKGLSLSLTNLKALNKPLENQRSLNYMLEIVKDSLSESTIHGLPHYVKRQNWCIRIVWAVCFFASSVICSYMIATSLISYFEYETVTKAKHIYQLSTEFPTISFCNQNPFLTNSSFEFIESLLIKNGFFTKGSSSDLFNNIFSRDLRFIHIFVGLILSSSAYNDDFRRSFSYNLSDMLLSCTYGNYFCNSNDFEWYFDMYHGNCYRFNSGKYANGSNAPIWLSTKAGSINGFTMELFLYEPNNAMSLSSSSGINY